MIILIKSQNISWWTGFFFNKQMLTKNEKAKHLNNSTLHFINLLNNNNNNNPKNRKGLQVQLTPDTFPNGSGALGADWLRT